MGSITNPKLMELHHSELNVLKQLNHPNCISCHEVITSDKECFIITDKCEGGDLDMYAKKRGYLTEEAAAPFLKDILSGLIYLADMHIVHRDLKVANVFLHRDKAKIADFGFAVFAQ